MLFPDNVDEVVSFDVSAEQLNMFVELMLDSYEHAVVSVVNTTSVEELLGLFHSASIRSFIKITYRGELLSEDNIPDLFFEPEFWEIVPAQVLMLLNPIFAFMGPDEAMLFKAKELAMNYFSSTRELRSYCVNSNSEGYRILKGKLDSFKLN